MKTWVFATAAYFLCGAYCGTEDDTFDFDDRSKWIDPSDMLNYDTGTQRMKKTMDGERPKSTPGPDVAKTMPGTEGKNIQFDGTVEEHLAQLSDLMSQASPGDRDKFIQLVGKYMPEYACGDDKTKSAVQLKLEKCQSDVRQLQSKAETEETSCSSSLEKTYFKQYIRALLRHYSRSVSDGSFLLYNTEILLNSDDIIILERFANTDYGSIQDAHEVLNRMIQHVELIEAGDTADWRFDVREHYKEYILLILQIVAIITLTSVAIALQVRLRLSWKQLLVKILILLFLISIPWNWWHMYKVAVAKRQAEAIKDIPLECRPEKQTATQSFWSALQNAFTLNTDKCAEYYEKMLVDPAYEVAPTQALAVTITKFVVEPLEHIGHAVGKLIHGTLQELPIQIWPFAMAFICVMSFFLLILVFGYRIKLFYLFGIEPGKDTPRHAIKDDKQQEELQSRIQDLTCQIEKLQLTQAGQVTFPSEETRATPVVSLFPAELPSTPKCVMSTDDVTESHIPAIEATHIKNEQCTRDSDKVCSTQQCENTETVPKTITTNQENRLCLNVGEKQCNPISSNVKMDKQKANTHQISLLEGPLKTDHPLSKTYLFHEGNVNSSELSEPSSNHIEIADCDSAMDLTLNKMNSEVKMISPAVDNLGAGDGDYQM